MVPSHEFLLAAAPGCVVRGVSGERTAPGAGPCPRMNSRLPTAPDCIVRGVSGERTGINCGRPVRALVGILFSSVALHAGFCSPSSHEPRHDFQFFGGYSPATSTLIGTVTDRRLVVAGFSYSYACWTWKSLTLSYTASALPAAIMLEPSETLYVFLPPYPHTSPAHTVYGFAVAPLGFTLEIAPARRVHPFAETMEGIIASTEPIPENLPNASGLNFLFDLGGGLRWRVAPRRAISIGYRFLHISNAGTTSFNPGVDNNVIYLGYSFRR
jgi:hypothetical protein